MIAFSNTRLADRKKEEKKKKKRKKEEERKKQIKTATCHFIEHVAIRN